MIVYVIPDAIRYSSAFLLSTTGGGAMDGRMEGGRGDGCRDQQRDEPSSQGEDFKNSSAFRELLPLWLFSC